MSHSRSSSSKIVTLNSRSVPDYETENFSRTGEKKSRRGSHRHNHNRSDSEESYTEDEYNHNSRRSGGQRLSHKAKRHESTERRFSSSATYSTKKRDSEHRVHHDKHQNRYSTGDYDDEFRGGFDDVYENPRQSSVNNRRHSSHRREEEQQRYSQQQRKSSSKNYSHRRASSTSSSGSSSSDEDRYQRSASKRDSRSRRSHHNDRSVESSAAKLMRKFNRASYDNSYDRNDSPVRNHQQSRSITSPLLNKGQGGRNKGGSSELIASKTLRELLGAPMVPFELSNENNAALIIIDAQKTYTDGIMKLENVEPALDECKELLNMARSVGVPVFHIQHDCGKGSPYDVSGESGSICDIVAPMNVVSKADIAKRNAAAAAAATPQKSGQTPSKHGETTAQKKKRLDDEAAAAASAKKNNKKEKVSDEFVIVKEQTSSFVGTQLEQLLKQLGVKNLAICGFMAHCCVESTTRDAAHKGYNCVVVSNAVATRNLPDPSYFNSSNFSSARAQDGAVVSAEELKRGALTALGDAFALIVPDARDIPVKGTSSK